MFDWWRRLTRAEVIAQEFPPRFHEQILRHVPCAKLLTSEELTKLEALVRIFNSEKTFEAAGGLTLTEEMRIVIARLSAAAPSGRARWPALRGSPDRDRLSVHLSRAE